MLAQLVHALASDQRGLPSADTGHLARHVGLELLFGHVERLGSEVFYEGYSTTLEGELVNKMFTWELIIDRYSLFRMLGNVREILGLPMRRNQFGKCVKIGNVSLCLNLTIL